MITFVPDSPLRGRNWAVRPCILPHDRMRPSIIVNGHSMQPREVVEMVLADDFLMTPSQIARLLRQAEKHPWLFSDLVSGDSPVRRAFNAALAASMRKPITPRTYE